jgi:hypothetical protein
VAITSHFDVLRLSLSCIGRPIEAPPWCLNSQRQATKSADQSIAALETRTITVARTFVVGLRAALIFGSVFVELRTHDFLSRKPFRVVRL